jgi:hypothetical protein
MEAGREKRPELVKIPRAEQKQGALACDRQVGEEILKQAREVEFVLFGRKSREQGSLEEFEHPVVGEEVAQQESTQEDPKTPDHAGFQLIQMLPKAHDRC